MKRSLDYVWISLTKVAMQEKITVQAGASWLETLAEFSYTLKHRAGLKHGNADRVSRLSCEDRS